MVILMPEFEANIFSKSVNSLDLNGPQTTAAAAVLLTFISALGPQ